MNTPPEGDELNQEMVDYFTPIAQAIYYEMAGEMEHLHRTTPSYRKEVEQWFKQSPLSMMIGVLDGGQLTQEQQAVMDRLCTRHKWHKVAKYFAKHISL